MNIDIRTLAFIACIINCLYTIALIFQYIYNRSIRGIGWCALGCSFFALGAIMILIRDIVSLRMLSIILLNALLITGQTFIYIGVVYFIDRKMSKRDTVFITAFFAASFLYYVSIVLIEDISVRIVIFSAMLVVISLMTIYKLFFNKDKRIMPSVNFTISGFIIWSCFLIIRILLTIEFHPVKNFFDPVLIQILTFIVPLIACTLGTFGFIFMVNQRLNAEGMEDKERFKLIFHNNPDANIIIHFETEKIADVNEGFTLLTGFTPNEVIGKSIIDLDIWNNSADRSNVIRELNKKEIIENLEVSLQHKDGSLITGILSAGLITLQDQPYIIIVIRNISDLKQTELSLRERFKELTCIYSIADLIEKMGEIEDIFQGSVNLMPAGWYYPEIACARISFKDQLFKTYNFKETIWNMSAGLVVHGKSVGLVEIYYLNEMPERDEGPFLKEERLLLNAIAERLGKVAERLQYEKEQEIYVLKLQKALLEIKNLSGLLPICAACKKIRNDNGYWEQVESYIKNHSEAEFSHCICPECMKKLYPEFSEEVEGESDK